MKLNFGKRLLLFLHWLLSLIICAVLVMLCLWPQIVDGLVSLVNGALGSGMGEILGIALLAIYAVISICCLILIFSRNKNRGERGFITVDSSDSGKTRIAVSAVEQMVRQAVRGVDGIAEMKCGIVNAEDSISINTSVTLLAGAHVPTVTMNMQRAIRGYIELNCGVAVREICISVNSVENTNDGKRASRKNLTAAANPAPVAEAAAPVSEPVIPEAETAPEMESAEVETAEADPETEPSEIETAEE